jgi:HxlR-like helix-turn-helix
MWLTSAPPCPRLLLASGCSFPSSLPAGSELSTRLKELEEAGLITREDAPPPIATVLYTLSETGMVLEPVLKSLGLWGLRLMAEERPDDAFQARWLAYAPEWFTTDADPGAPPAVIQLVAADESAVVELGDGRVRTMPQAKRRVAGGVLGGDLARAAAVDDRDTGAGAHLQELPEVDRRRVGLDDDALGDPLHSGVRVVLLGPAEGRGRREGARDGTRWGRRRDPGS